MQKSALARMLPKLLKYSRGKRELELRQTNNISLPEAHDHLAQKEAPKLSRELVKEETARIPLPKKGAALPKLKKDISEELRLVNASYPLITIMQGRAQVPLAYAQIRFNPQVNQLQYALVEPELDPKLKDVVEKTRQELHDRLEVDFSQLKLQRQVYEYINKKIEEVWHILGVKLSSENALKVKYHLFRDVIGFSKIDALMYDTNIEDISCDGFGLPIYIFHRHPLYGEMATNVSFAEKDELDAFVMKLAQKCGRTISVASPLLDGALPDGSRVQITYGTDIARKGSNFTIRKFFRVPLTPIDLINFGTVDSLTLAYLWFAIEKEKSVLIAGTTATGKTTFLNAISLFIEPNLKIVSIEDTAELQLPHINWMPQVTRVGYGPQSYGEITMDDLLRAALRQRPDYLIVGEVRGREANVLFHAMATGHASLCTLHADTVDAIIDRLTTRPIELPLALLENLDIIVFLEKVKKEGKFTRRVSQVIEVEGYDHKSQELKTNEVFKWKPADDTFASGQSYILQKLAEHANLSMQDVHEELLRRASVLDWMKKKGTYHFADVSQLIRLYYIDPKKLAGLMGITA